MNRNIFLTLLIHLVFVIYANSDNLQDSVSLAIKNSQDTEIIDAQFDISKGEYIKSFSLFLPNVSMSGSYYFYKNSPNLGSSLIGFYLPILGKDSSYGQFNAGIEISLYRTIPLFYASKIKYDSSKYETSIKLSNFITKVIILYANITSGRKKEKSAKLSEEIAKKMLEKAIIMFDNKLITELDLDIARAALFQAESLVLESQSTLEKDESDYEFLTKQTLKDPDLDYNLHLPMKTFDDLKDIIIERSPQLKKADADSKIAIVNNVASYTNLLPRFSIAYTRLSFSSAVFNPFDSSGMFFDAVGISMTWDIFDSGRSWADVYIAHKQNKLAVASKNLQKQDILSSAKKEWISYKSLEKTVQAKERYLAFAKNTLEKAKKNRENKIISELDELKVQYDFLLKEIDLINAKRDKLVSYYKILSIAGINPLISF